PVADLGDAARAERSDVAYVGDVVGGLLLHANAHDGLLAPTMRPGPRACFAVVAELFARLAPQARPPARGATRPPARRAHAEVRTERPRERRRRGEAMIERDL